MELRGLLFGTRLPGTRIHRAVLQWAAAALRVGLLPLEEVEQQAELLERISYFKFIFRD
jgi:hypothetical protein